MFTTHILKRLFILFAYCHCNKDVYVIDRYVLLYQERSVLSQCFYMCVCLTSQREVVQFAMIILYFSVYRVEQV